MTDASSPHHPGPPDLATSGAFGLVAHDLVRQPPEPDALGLVDGDFARRHRLVPVRCTGAALVVAVADPLATDGLDRLATRLRRVVDPVLVDDAALDQALAVHYPTTPATPTPFAYGEPSRVAASVVQEDAGEAVVPLVQALLDEAVRRRASDVHLEPVADRLRVRYRIDGVLHEGPEPPSARRAGIVSRVKILAQLSLAEKRLPQDGRLRVTAEGRTFDVRVSSLPTLHGESLVLRLLDPEALAVGLPDLGLAPDDAELLTRLLGVADGLVLVTGPTGSGKTTTLYSCLHYLNGPGRKLITVEDPVEYQLSGVNQVPVRPEVGMTFAAALRAILRQAPNVVMIGEIRDRETADIALQAALTGHLVFSTLHTNDAPGAITRLLDLGARPYLVAAALRAAVAQRLVRKICAACARPHALDAGERRLLAAAGRGEAGRWAAGAGCPACAGTGFRGRVGLFELLPLSEVTRQIICENASPGRLRAHARSQGRPTLREDGLNKAAAGLTTLAEVMAATVDDPS